MIQAEPAHSIVDDEVAACLINSGATFKIMLRTNKGEIYKITAHIIILVE